MLNSVLSNETTNGQLDQIWQRLGGSADRPDFRFDSANYTAVYKDVATAGLDPKHHYESHGSSEGRKPNRYHQNGFDKDPQISEKLLKILKDPELVDLVQREVPGAAELAYELLTLGDPVDKTISNFSGIHYLSAYQDVKASGIEPLMHYLKFGHKESRDTLARVRANVHKGKLSYNPHFPTCLISTHEFSRTGAPAVALDIVREAAQKYNVIVMGHSGGALLEQFRDASCHVIVSGTPFEDWDYFDVPGLENIEFAILNSVESYSFVKPLVAHGIPFLAYIHEFADYIIPNYKSVLIALYANIVVFSSASVKLSWQGILTDVGFDTENHSRLLAQARLDFVPAQTDRCLEARDRLSSILGVDCGSRRIVYGAGQMQIRKGTDLFILTAQQTHEIDPDVLFIWIGDGANHEDVAFGVWLEKHMREANANDPNGNLFFLPAGSYYSDVCAAADILFLPSRLDPLPNVVFDAARNGCTTVMFKGATGFDDARYNEMSSLVKVGYGNLSAASRAILRAPRKLSWRRFLSIRGAEYHVITQDVPVFDTLLGLLHGVEKDTTLPKDLVGGVSVLFRGEDEKKSSVYKFRERSRLSRLDRQAIWPNVDSARKAISDRGGWFHARTHIESHRDIHVDEPALTQIPPFFVHIHAHYLDDLESDLSRFAAYRLASSIVVTTDSDRKATKISKYANAAGISVDLRVTGNQGRDILPFLNIVAAHESEDDSIWCHVHQKKSVTSTIGGDLWRDFLMRILLGDRTHVSSALSHIARPDTGLVTAFDPYIVGWTATRKLIPYVERRLGRRLPEVPLLFPVGNMFWARAGVVRSMLSIFGQEYAWPNEPLPNDGTVYHLIERLWPGVASKSGFNSIFLDRPETKRA